MDSEIADRALSAWLKSKDLCGCRFAALSASQKKIFLSVTLESFNDSMVNALNSDFDMAATRKNFALAVFPQISSEDEIAALVATLARNKRWQVIEYARDRLHKMIELRWQKGVTIQCNAVGFAPTLGMPATRRAPYVALGVWPCGNDNPFLDHPGKIIGVADTAHGQPRNTYDSMFSETTSGVEQILGATFSKAHLRRLTFRLPV